MNVNPLELIPRQDVVIMQLKEDVSFWKGFSFVLGFLLGALSALIITSIDKVIK